MLSEESGQGLLIVIIVMRAAPMMIVRTGSIVMMVIPVRSVSVIGIRVAINRSADFDGKVRISLGFVGTTTGSPRAARITKGNIFIALRSISIDELDSCAIRTASNPTSPGKHDELRDLPTPTHNCPAKEQINYENCTGIVVFTA
jgi:hypothetical protein